MHVVTFSSAAASTWRKPSSLALVLCCMTISIVYSVVGLTLVLCEEDLKVQSVVLLVIWAVLAPVCTITPVIIMMLRQKHFLAEMESALSKISSLKFSTASETFRRYSSMAPPDYTSTCDLVEQALTSLNTVSRYIPTAQANPSQVFEVELGSAGGSPVASPAHLTPRQTYVHPHRPSTFSPAEREIEKVEKLSRGSSHKILRNMSQGRELAYTLDVLGSGSDKHTANTSDADERSECSSVCDSHTASEATERRTAHTSLAKAVSAVITAKNAFSRPKQSHPPPELSYRKITTELIINLRGFNAFVKAMDLDSVLAFHIKWLEAVVSDAKKESGYLERCMGDEVHMNFGGVVPCSSPGLKAGRYALKLRERLTTLYKTEKLKEHTSVPETFIGAAQGPAICGYVGVDGLRGSAVFGRLIYAARALQIVAQDTGFDILLDRRISEDCQGHITSVPVDVIQVGNGPTQEVYHPMYYAGNSPDEWLYSITTDLNYERAWKILRSGDVPLAFSLMTAYAQQSRSATAGMVAERIKNYIDAVTVATGEGPTEYCRSVRMMSVGPRPLMTMDQGMSDASPPGSPCTPNANSREAKRLLRVSSMVPQHLVPSPSLGRMGSTGALAGLVGLGLSDAPHAAGMLASPALFPSAAAPHNLPTLPSSMPAVPSCPPPMAVDFLKDSYLSPPTSGMCSIR